MLKIIHDEAGLPIGVFMGIHDLIRQQQIEEELRKHSGHLNDLLKERTEELGKKTKELEKTETAFKCLLKDINAVRRDLENANKQLKELDQLKSMFVASMSHELRTPLNSIIGFTGVILQGMVGDTNAEQRDHLQRVYSAAKHLLALITDVIDISKIEAGKLEPYAEEFQLVELLNEAILSFKKEIDNKKLGIEINMHRDLRLNTDRRRLMQSVLNYLSNAVKFTEKGKIVITVDEVDELVEIKVKDTGIGIKEENMSRLFNSFVRLDTSLKVITPGTGLGLYLTKKLVVDVLGGEVAVESKYGVGSAFILKIPVVLQSHSISPQN